VLSPRELMIIEIRAEDRASAQMRAVGNSSQTLMSTMARGSLSAFAYSQAFDTVGRGLSRVGTVITAAVGLAVKAATDFGHAMALANTQAQLSEAALDKLSDAALEVSSRYGVAATEIADALYDIFSTTDQTAEQAVQSIDALAKAAVTGGVTMREATRGVIDIQNAFGESAGSTTDILDLQFAMLRQSAGTYGELVNAFGNVIGSAKATDQALNSVAGAIAFLTVRGRSQAEASISVSRALDQITRSAAGIEKVLGVAVYDAAGNFRALEDIINDMGMAMDDMTSKERSAAFEKMFGAGSIQANRFFRTAIPQFEALNEKVRELAASNVGGELAKQFEILKASDPSYVFNKLKTSATNLGISLARELMPDLLKLAEYLGNLAESFNNLDPGTKKMTARLVLLGGVFALLGGKVLTFIGTWLRLKSVFQLAGLASGASSVGKTAGLLSKLSFAYQAVAGGAATFGEALAYVFPLLSKLAAPLALATIAVHDLYNAFRAFQDEGILAAMQAETSGWAADLVSKINPVAGEVVKLGSELLGLAQTADKLDFTKFTGGVAKIGDTIKATGGAILAMPPALAGMDEAMLTTAGVVKKNMGIISKETRDSVVSSLTALGDYSKGWDLTSAQLARNIDGMRAKMRQFSRELTALSRAKWVPEQFKAWLIEQGPAAVVAFGGANRRMKEGMVRDWQAIMQGASRTGQEIDDVGRKVSELDRKKANPRIDAKDTATRTIEQVKDRLMGLNGSSATVSINVIGNMPQGYYTAAAGGVLATGGITGMAKGGARRGMAVTKGPTYLTGEGNYPTFAGKGAEAVIPLHTRGLNILSEAVSRGLAMNGGVGMGGGGTTNIYVEPKKAVIDANDVAREMDWLARTRGW